MLLSQTTLFADPQSRRIALAGPPALVSAEASQMIAMAIYELATNAVKFGALSTDAGRVAIGWSFAGDKGAAKPAFDVALPMQRYYRDIRLYSFAPLTNDVVASFLGERWLGLPRSY